MHRPRAAILLAIALLTLPQRRAAGQWMFMTDHDHPYRAMYVLGADLLPVATTLTVSGRRDGWVELEFENVMVGGVHAPWLITQSETQVNEPRTRGYFTPAEARRAAAVADSIFAAPQRWNSAAKRYEPPVLVATPLFLTPRMSPVEPSLLYWWMRPYQVGRFNVPPHASVEFAFCYNLMDGLSPRGGDLSLEQFTALIRSIRDAATYAQQLSAVPEPLSADVIEARDAACEARPRLHPVPAYPAHSGASLGDVHVDATVDTSGQIEVPIRVLFATDSVFAAQAVTALKSWRFAPALLMLGKPVRQRIHVQVHFDPNALARDQVKNLLIAAGDHGAGILVIARRPEASQTRMSSAMR